MSSFSPEAFASRHIGPSPSEIQEMLATLGLGSLEELLDRAVPAALRATRPPAMPPALDERAALDRLRAYASENEVWRSYIGMGYHGTVTPPVIQRNLLENPGWYTAYTPYQAEISQGRLEALLNYQTMVCDLTGMQVANASLLDEATAAAEAMTMALRCQKKRKDARVFLVDAATHPQTIAVVRTRAEPLGIEVVVSDPASWVYDRPTFGVLLGYPGTDGVVRDLRPFVEAAHQHGALVAVTTDLLALTMLTPPGELGADIALGNSQRFGVPLGYGGPHAAFFATKEEFVRQMAGRLIGVAVDVDGNRALRMALQTREQHIRREKATSNICTAQVLLAVIASMYAVWHGPEGLTRIAGRVHRAAAVVREGARRGGFTVAADPFFDTVVVQAGARRDEVLERARDRKINLRDLGEGRVAVALDETVGARDLRDLLVVFGCTDSLEVVEGAATSPDFGALARTSPFLTHPVFARHHSETEMMRYLRRLQNRDLGLDTAMIPLGSCTMKLNAATEMIPVTFEGFGKIHPFAPPSQAQGYRRLFHDLEAWLAALTGFDAVSLQPNAGSQGEYAGLLTIRAYHLARGDVDRTVCLIPRSAHGTNPASAAMVGLDVVVVNCLDNGDIDLADLEAKADQHADKLAALMVTYPSTHGVFEDGIRRICDVVHQRGGQVYLDGANLNALVGVAYAADLGADVCHINLHKTFAIPHGGGGPGMGPICVKSHLAPFLPGHPVIPTGGATPCGTVSAAPWGSASILPISWAYIAMLGAEGIRQSTAVAILNANYVSRKLAGAFDTLYRGAGGLVAHECILDLRPIQRTSGIGAEDVAKRLMDYGFHAPTMSWPVIGTLMVEPTESEGKGELDRFIEAMVQIRAEIRAIEEGRADREDNPLKHAPHTARCVIASAWDHAYSREEAVYPTAWTRGDKYWPTVRRVDNVYGDKHLVCSCPPLEDYE
jgi:glycine dehydrogenase